MKATIKDREILSEKFREWLKGLPALEYNVMKNRIIRECRINSQIFRHWKCGATRIPELAQEKINQLADCVVFDLEKI